MKTEILHKKTTQKWRWMGLLIGSFPIIILLGPSFSFADPALRYQRASNRVERRDERAGGRIENRQERSGNRIERRDERAGGRIENRQERQGNRIERRDERMGGRIENQQERSGNRIERRDERITNRIERRDMLLSPPAGATVVSVGGVQGYRVGADVYKPAFYEGETVYVKVGAE